MNMKSKRSLNSLQPHEKPSSWRIWKLAKMIRNGTTFPPIYISEDGMILDGHGRYYAFKRVFGKDAIVEVEISTLSRGLMNG